MVAEDPDVESVPAAETAAVESDEAEVQKKVLIFFSSHRQFEERGSE